MWNRTIESMLGVWLLMSPFIFQHPGGKPLWWVNDWVCGTLIILLASFSFLEQTRRAYLLELVVAAWLMASGWVAAGAGLGAPAHQNWMCTGLLILLLAIIPTDNTALPEAWRRWYEREGIEPPEV